MKKLLIATLLLVALAMPGVAASEDGLMNCAGGDQVANQQNDTSTLLQLAHTPEEEALNACRDKCFEAFKSCQITCSTADAGDMVCTNTCSDNYLDCRERCDQQ